MIFCIPLEKPSDKISMTKKFLVRDIIFTFGELSVEKFLDNHSILIKSNFQQAHLW